MKMGFGRYADFEIFEVARDNPSYIQWLLKQDGFADKRPQHVAEFRRYGISAPRMGPRFHPHDAPVEPPDSPLPSHSDPDSAPTHHTNPHPPYRSLDRATAKTNLTTTSDADLHFLITLCNKLLTERHYEPITSGPEPTKSDDSVPF